MVPSIVEKLGHVAVLAVLYQHGRISRVDASAGWPDLVLGILFIAAFVKTRHD
jgi:hypothetical protein